MISKFIQIVVAIILCAGSNSYADIKDRGVVISGLQDKINASEEGRYREFLEDLLRIISSDAPEITQIQDASWTCRTGLCYHKSLHLKEALNRLKKYKLRMIHYDAEYDHFYLIVDDFSPRIIIDPTYLQMFYNNDSSSLNPLFVGTADELVSIFEKNKALFKPLNLFDKVFGVGYTAKDYVQMIWGYTAERPPQKVIEIKMRKNFGK